MSRSTVSHYASKPNTDVLPSTSLVKLLAKLFNADACGLRRLPNAHNFNLVTGPDNSTFDPASHHRTAAWN